ncbi:MAG: Regulator of RpoS [Candidatus Omnitrophica bacterium]|nr:Regulator of RpoS [Candidatus Omnitrophota bacterium]
MAHNKMVLVIDDEAAITRLVKSAMEQAGYRVLTASDGDEGLELARQSRPDLLILDLNMPRKSGLQVYNDIVVDKEHKLFPVIILTGRGELEDLFKDLKADGFIAKPIDFPRLIAMADKILKIDRSLGSGGSSPRRILIYDNNDQLLEKVVLTLVKSGHEVHVESSSQRLFDRLRNAEGDFLILDLLLADRSFIAQLKELPRQKAPQVLYFVVRSEKISYSTVFELAEKLGLSVQHIVAIGNPAELVTEINKRLG